jgi:hypothetical protein
MKKIRCARSIALATSLAFGGCHSDSSASQARVGCAALAIRFLETERGKFDGTQFDGKYKYIPAFDACLVDVRMVELTTHWESRYIVDLLTSESIAFYGGSTDPAKMLQDQHAREYAFKRKEMRLFGDDDSSLKSRLKLDDIK